MPSDINPYRAQAGPELDSLIHRHVMHRTEDPCPSYSSDDGAAELVLARLKSVVEARITVGQTRLRDRRWFARYETNPSDGTEAVAPTRALAICRLGLVWALK